MLTLFALSALLSASSAGPVQKRQASSTVTSMTTSTVPQYFQITPEVYNGKIACKLQTGKAHTLLRSYARRLSAVLG